MRMLSYARNYFRNCRLARMSNGEYCLIRDQGLVKGGRGLKHHETLMVFSIRGVAAKYRQSPAANAIRERGSFVGRCFARLCRGLACAQSCNWVIRTRPDEKGVIGHGRSESDVTDLGQYNALDA